MNPELPRVGEYREAVGCGDLAGAARHWQAAGRSPHSHELREQLKREFDFSQVQDYSLAWQTGDLKMLEVIGKRAIAQPDHRLSRLLEKVVDSHPDSTTSTHPEVEAVDAVPPEMAKRGMDFIKGLVQASRQGTDVQQFAKKYGAAKVTYGAGKASIHPKNPTKHPVKSSQENPDKPQPSQTTLKHLIDFINQATIKNHIALTALEIETLRNHQNLELPVIAASLDLDRWAKEQNLKLSAKTLKQLYRASLLFTNRMSPSDASNLAMAARSQTKKKSPKPPPENPST